MNMKNPVSPKIFPLLSATTGVLGLIFRFWLYSVGIDDKGLLIQSHPAHILIWLTVAVTFGLSAAGVQNLPTSATTVFPASRLSAVGAMVAAACLLIADFIELVTIRDTVNTISFFLGLLACAGLVLTGLRRLTGQPGIRWAGLALTLYFMVHMIVQYRLWSGEPQLQNYFFPLMASVFLMLCCYYRTALEQTGKGLRLYVFFNQCALLCCLMALNTSSWLFYGAMSLWTATDLPICSGKEN